ncbi:MAG: ABC transporter permease [Bacteroidota bacterium]
MNSKTWIILKREYLNIVRKPTFLLSTFLVPLGLAAIFGIQILAIKVVEKDQFTVLMPAGEQEVIFKQLTSTDEVTFVQTDKTQAQLLEIIESARDSLVMTLPGLDFIGKPNSPDVTLRLLYGKKNPSQVTTKEIEKKVRKVLEGYKRDLAGISVEEFQQTQFKLAMQQAQIKDGKEVKRNENIALVLGFGIGFLVYMLIGIYGSILMQSVVEEKSNKIVEVIVASAEPFQLLLGKTLAIALVGVTQFLIWVVFSGLLLLGTSLMIGPVDPEMMSQPGVDVDAQMAQAQAILGEIYTFDWTVLWYLPIFFLGGFFLYGSLLAAAGSTVDNIQDAQQFTLPVTMLLILPILFLQNIIQNPNSFLAVFASLFPFFSPMSMLVRMSLTQVPWYQIVLSIGLLIGSFLGTIWLAGRIYRTGVLMYGKKPSFKEVFKWIGYK